MLDLIYILLIFGLMTILVFICTFDKICCCCCYRKRQVRPITLIFQISNIPPQDDVCPICQEKEIDDKWLVLPCKHKFHSKCITQSTPCPVCRTYIVNEKKSIEYV